jgi:hypothetical protein
LRNNNLTGLGADIFHSLIGAFKELAVLDVAENQLSGFLHPGIIHNFSKLEHIDISNNAVTGYADMSFPSSALYANFSHNCFTGFSFKRFNSAYESLKVINLSNNVISQDASKVFDKIPPNLQELVLSNNSITGTLPDPLPLWTCPTMPSVVVCQTSQAVPLCSGK